MNISRGAWEVRAGMSRMRYLGHTRSAHIDLELELQWQFATKMQLSSSGIH
jgi:hypothetical protein